MTNNENMERKNSMVATEDEKDNAAVIGVALAEPNVTKDESSECVADENAETVSDEDTDTAGVIVPVDAASDTADNAVNETESEETTDEKMNRSEKIILVIIGILLALLLLWLGVRAFNGMQRNTEVRDHESGISFINEDTTGNADNGNDAGAVDTGNGNGFDNDISNGYHDATSGTPDNGNNGNDAGNNGNSNGNGATTIPPETTEKDNSSDNSGGNSGSNNQNDKSDDAAPDYTGDTKIRITKVNDDTGVITISVGDEKIVVPVQTTLFNGRVSKSGVAQGKLFGYNCGAAVMLFYPQADGMGETDYNGYMSRTGDSLTILVDINGENSKLLIKINGFKSL